MLIIKNYQNFGSKVDRFFLFYIEIAKLVKKNLGLVEYFGIWGPILQEMSAHTYRVSKKHLNKPF